VKQLVAVKVQWVQEAEIHVEVDALAVDAKAAAVQALQMIADRDRSPNVPHEEQLRHDISKQDGGSIRVCEVVDDPNSPDFVEFRIVADPNGITFQ